MDCTSTNLESLGTKLDDLDLTPGEKAALAALLVAASTQHDVSGFAYDLNPDDLSFTSLVVGFTPWARGEFDQLPDGLVGEKHNG